MNTTSTKLERLVLTVAEVRQVLGLSDTAVRLAIRRGEIPSFKIGDRTLVPRKALEALVGEPVAYATSPVADQTAMVH